MRPSVRVLFEEVGGSKQAEAVFTQPRHPYSKALLSATLAADPDAGGQRLVLQGEVPSPINPPSGCRFHPRCRYATEICAQQEPPLVEHGAAGHLAACHHPLNVGAPD